LTLAVAVSLLPLLCFDLLWGAGGVLVLSVSMSVLQSWLVPSISRCEEPNGGRAVSYRRVCLISFRGKSSQQHMLVRSSGRHYKKAS